MGVQTKMTRLFLGVFCCAVVLALFPGVSQAATALDSIPDAVKSQYTFNGSIYAAVSDGNTLYVGGEFTSVALSSPGDPVEYERTHIAAIDLSTYTLTTLDTVLDDAVRSLELASDGTLYVGGDFSTVDGAENPFLVALNTSTGVALSSFASAPDASVVALALSPDESVLYGGGGFSTPASNVVAYTTSDRTETAFSAQADLSVRALSVSSDGASLYIGGDFTKVGGEIPQIGIARVDADTGVLDGSFASALSGGSIYGMQLSSDDGVLYVGGDFDTFFTQSGEGAIFNETTKAFVASPKVSTQAGGGDATIYAVIPDGDGGWYIGGSFTHVGNTAQARLAHITAAGALDTSFDPVINNGQVNALELSLDGTVLYAGGSFNQVEGVAHRHVAAFSTATGAATAFDPDPDATVRDLELSSDGDTLYIAGDFSAVAGGSRHGIAAFDVGTDGSLLAFDADLYGAGYAIELSADDSVLYAGGNFTSVKYGAGPGTLRDRIAAFTTAGAGAVTAFNPGADSIVHDLLLSGGGGTLYAGGEFSVAGGEARGRFAALDTVTGSSAGLSDIGITGGIAAVFSMGVASDGETVYLGGDDFAEVGGVARTRFAEIDAATGAVTSFNPAFDDTVYAVAVDASAGRLYVGGSSSGFGFETASKIVAINTADGSFVSSFAPSANNTVRVLKLSPDDTILYAGGLFTDISSTARNYLAALDTSDGSLTAFDPSGTFSVYGMSLAPDDSELYVGSFDDGDAMASDLLIFDADGDAGGAGDDDDDDGSGGGDTGSSGSSRRGAAHSTQGNSRLFFLLERLRDLLRELVSIGGTIPPGAEQYLMDDSVGSACSFGRDLTLGDRGNDVICLQKILITRAVGTAGQALGANGATGFFGALTQAALTEFQASVGITPSAGYFGSVTRAYMSTL